MDSASISGVALTPALVGSPGVTNHFQDKVNVETWVFLQAVSLGLEQVLGSLAVCLAQAYQKETIVPLLYPLLLPHPHALYLQLPVSRPKSHPPQFKTVIPKKFQKGNGGSS